MTSIKYSIIISHKDIPTLLKRCLDSIPAREDVQIVVVDADSDPSIVDFEHFPGMDRPDVEVVLTKEGKGAGYARNTGLDKAVGDWLIFMDADDFFSEHFSDILDTFPDQYDMVIYDHIAVMSDDISVVSGRDSVYHRFIRQFLDGDKSENNLRSSFHSLWGKIIRRSLVLDNDIRFDETKWSNDVFFSCQTGYHAKSIEVIGGVMYVLTQRSGSLTSNFCGTKEEFRVRMGEIFKSESFLAAQGIHSDCLDSDMMILNYYNRYGCISFFKQVLSQHFLSKIQLKMVEFLMKLFKERIARGIARFASS